MHKFLTATGWVLGFTILCVYGSPVQAATLTFPGSAPCNTTFQACINGANSGDTIQIATNSRIHEADVNVHKSLTLTAAPGFSPIYGDPNPVGSGRTDRLVFDDSQAGGSPVNVVISKINFDGGTVQWFASAVPGNHFEMLDCQMSYDILQVDRGITTFFQAPTTFLVKGNTFHISGTLIHAFADSNVSGIIEQNVFGSLNPAAAIQRFGIILSPGSGTLDVDIVNNIFKTQGLTSGAVHMIPTGTADVAVNILNNTFDELLDPANANLSAAIFIDRRDSSILDVNIFNNIISNVDDNAVSINNSFPDPSLTIANGFNDFFNNGGTDSDFVEGPGTLHDDPLYANAPGEDYHLLDSSTLIDAGNNIPPGGLPDVDFADLPRISGDTVDIGAFEKQIVPGPLTVVDDSVALDAPDFIPGNGICETAPGNGECTLRAAIMEANALPGPDVITVPAGTYSLFNFGLNEDAAATGDLDITSDITLNGAGSGTTIIDGAFIDRVFHILSGSVTIRGVKVFNGRSFPKGGIMQPGGGILVEGGTVILEALVFHLNVAGSGFLLGLPSTPGADGGGLAVSGGAVTLRQSTLFDNHGGQGSNGDNGPNDGGNGGNGGGVFVSGGSLTLSQVTLDTNLSGFGGLGADSSGGEPSGGGNGGFGGGLFASGGSIVLENVTFSGNSAGIGGDGGNGAAPQGLNDGGNGGDGGGIALTGSASASLNNVTITDNHAGDGGAGGNDLGQPGDPGNGGGIFNVVGVLEFKNSIIAQNLAAFGGANPDCFGNVVSLGFNLVGDNSICFGLVGSDAQGTSGSPLDPGLDPAGLANNGGPTQTIAILPGSPAKDTANNATCEAIDQRGEARPIGGPSQCDKGAFEITACGDGATQTGETCDDGDQTGGDGCSATCQIESGFACAGTPSICTPNCGDGVVLGSEVCDDGNSLPGDGCSPVCSIESGFSCAGSPSTCTPNCGDGAVAGSEVCDDGNSAAGDGCSPACATELGFTCTGSPSICTTDCGDGIKASSEACDDGDQTAGDGCSATCTVESGFTCAGSPSTCVKTGGGGGGCALHSEATNTFAGGWASLLMLVSMLFWRRKSASSL